MQLVESGYFFALPIPKQALEPVDLRFQLGNIAVGFGDGSGLVLDFSQQLNINFNALRLNNMLTDLLEDAITI